MKNRLIALLLWLLLWIMYWWYEMLEKKEYINNQNQKIQNEIKRINYDNNQNKINNIKNNIITWIKSDEKEIIKKSNINIEIYNYWSIYKKMYDIIMKDVDVNNMIWHKDFKNTIMAKRLDELKESIIHTKIIYNNTWKEIEYDYIPLDIECFNNLFCKKQIDKDLNDIYLSDNSILKIIDIDKEIKKSDVINIIMSKKDFYNYFNNK